MEFENNTKIKIGSERNFAILFCVVFFIVSLWPLLWTGGEYRTWALIVSIFLLLSGLIYPSLYKYPNRLWFRLGNFLGGIIGPFVMWMIFYGTVVPTGFFMKIFGKKDILKQNFNLSAETYWEDRINSKTSMEDQY